MVIQAIDRLNNRLAVLTVLVCALLVAGGLSIWLGNPPVRRVDSPKHLLVDPPAVPSQKTDSRVLYIVNMNLSAHSQRSARRIESSVRSLCGCTTVIEHYADVSKDRVKSLNPAGIILSGQGDPWDRYPKDSLVGLREAVKSAECPVLGICGGHQFIAMAYGGKVDRIRRLTPGSGYQGCWKESGYVGATVGVTDPVIGSKGQKITVYEAHYDEIKRLPPGFAVLASNKTCAVQAMKADSRPVYGVQFHPETWDDKHPDGERILSGFLKLCTERCKD